MELSPDATNPINTNLTELIFRNCKIIDRSDHWSLSHISLTLSSAFIGFIIAASRVH
jgi:hypothetical protein